MVHSCDKHPQCGFTSICCGCLVDYNNAVAKLKKHRWIPVEEGLPEEDADCLTFDSKFVGMGCYEKNSDTLRMQWQVNGYVSKTVTHWKPIILPEGE